MKPLAKGAITPDTFEADAGTGALGADAVGGVDTDAEGDAGADEPSVDALGVGAPGVNAGNGELVAAALEVGDAWRLVVVALLVWEEPRGLTVGAGVTL